MKILGQSTSDANGAVRNDCGRRRKLRRAVVGLARIETPASSVLVSAWERGNSPPDYSALVLAMLDLWHDLAPGGAVGAGRVSYDPLWRLAANRRAAFVFRWICTISSSAYPS
jgi:hypothetical protein